MISRKLRKNFRRKTFRKTSKPVKRRLTHKRPHRKLKICGGNTSPNSVPTGTIIPHTPMGIVLPQSPPPPVGLPLPVGKPVSPKRRNKSPSKRRNKSPSERRNKSHSERRNKSHSERRNKSPVKESGPPARQSEPPARLLELLDRIQKRMRKQPPPVGLVVQPMRPPSAFQSSSSPA